MITESQINQFFCGGPIAIAGVSRNPLKFGHLAFKTLAAKGQNDLLPINPQTDTLFGKTCYRNVASLPDNVHALVLFTHPEETASMVVQAMKKGIRNIWIQRGSESPEALQLADIPGYNIIHSKCVIMFNNARGYRKVPDTTLRMLAEFVVEEKSMAYN